MCWRRSRRSNMVTKKLIETKLLNGPNRPSILVVDIKAKALNKQVFKELDNALDDIQRFQNKTDGTKIHGVIFTSSDNKIFLAGADLYEMRELLDTPMLASAIIDIGQDIFNKIQSLTIPTVAAINGICLGGGYELALACKYRICSNDRATKIGLPEVTLGILPAWGGSTRLPRLIGMPNALNVILSGKQFAAKPAKRIGLVDAICHKENLVDTAVRIINGSQRIKRKSFPFAVPDWIACKVAKKNVLKKTKGNYPAPLKIIEMLKQGNNTSIEKSLALEKDYFLHLIKTEEMQNLIRIFFLQEKSKKLKRLHESKGVSVHSPIKDVVVVGAGTMGAGIAQWVSSRDINVTLKDVNEDLISNGLKTVGKLYVDGVLGHKLDRPSARAGIARVSTATTNIPLDDKDILIEAIVEKLDVKQKVLAQLEEKLSNHAIIATNTSALSIDEMADCLNRPDRFVGIHFFNPVHKMKLVEVVRGKHTTDETVYRAVKFVQQIGKLPVVVKDSPGFVVNRILVPYLVEACRLHSTEGIDLEEVDQAMVKWGMPMGPFRLMDEIGLDICQHVAVDLYDRLPGLEDLPTLIQEHINDGLLGKKTEQGFYKYKKNRSIKRKMKLSRSSEQTTVERLVGSMVHEAKLVLKEGVVETSDDIDFAMIMGTGFAPFRGGPLNYEYRHI